jgi:hypothetical protein
VVGVLVEGHGGGDLDRLEGPVVEVGLELGQGLHDLGVADQVGHAPAGHGEGLGHRVQLDRALLGPFGLEDRGWAEAVEAELGVGVVVDQQNLVLEGEVDHPLHEGQVDAGGGRVVGERQHDHPGPGPGEAPGLLDVLEEVLVGADGDLADVGPGEQRPPDVDGVRRRGDQGGVARLEQHPHQVGEALLGPNGGDGLGLRVEVDAEAPGVQVGHGLAQLGDAPAGRVAVVARVPDRLAQLVHGRRGRRQVGVAEAEVDHVLAGPPGRHLQPVDDGEHIRRQVRDPAELQRRPPSGSG